MVNWFLQCCVTSELQSHTIQDKYQQENSAKLTNQRVRYAFSSSPLSFHARHVLPTSKFQHSYSCILLIFYITDISEQHVWELWVWIQSTGLTFPLRVTPMNKPITLITSTVAGLHFCCRLQYMRSSANFRTVFSEARTPANWMPSSDQILTQNDHSRSFKVIRFGVNEEPLRGYIVQFIIIVAMNVKVQKT